MSTQQNDNYMIKFNPPDTLTELLIKRLNADIQNGTSYVLNEIEDELKYVFGEDWRKFLSNSSLLFFKSKAIDSETGHFEGNSGIALSLLMLKRGYVYNNGRCLLYSKSSPKSECGSEFYYTNEHAERACKLIEDELRRKHPELPESFYIGSAEYASRNDELDRDKVYKILGAIVIAIGIPFCIVGSDAFFVFLWMGVGYIVSLLAAFIIDLVKSKKKKINRASFSVIAFRAMLIEVGLIILIGIPVILILLSSLNT